MTGTVRRRLHRATNLQTSKAQRGAGGVRVGRPARARRRPPAQRPGTRRLTLSAPAGPRGLSGRSPTPPPSAVTRVVYAQRCADTCGTCTPTDAASPMRPETEPRKWAQAHTTSNPLPFPPVEPPTRAALRRVLRSLLTTLTPSAWRSTMDLWGTPLAVGRTAPSQPRAAASATSTTRKSAGKNVLQRASPAQSVTVTTSQEPRDCANATTSAREPDATWDRTGTPMLHVAPTRTQAPEHPRRNAKQREQQRDPPARVDAENSHLLTVAAIGGGPTQARTTTAETLRTRMPTGCARSTK